MGESQDGNIGPTSKQPIKNETFVVDFMIQGAKNMARIPLSAPNKESLLAVATAITAANIQQIYGFNAYRSTDPACNHMDPEKCKDLEFVAHAPVMDVMAQIVGVLQKAVGRQILTAAVPAHNPTSAEFQKMVDEARRMGKAP